MINTFEQNDVTVSKEAVTQVVNHGALHYTIGMRGFFLSVPLALWLFGPIWMLAGSLVLVTVLYRLDREAYTNLNMNFCIFHFRFYLARKEWI